MTDEIVNCAQKCGAYIPQKVAKLDEYSPVSGSFKIRLDANESPFPPTPEILDEFTNALKSIEFNRYPDPLATELLKEISNSYHIPTNCLVVGNGSDELISLICGGLTEPDESVTVALPDFSMYEFYSSLSGARVFHYFKDENNVLDLERLSDFANENRSKIVIFSNPCNPTGECESREEIINFVRSTDSLVIVDEAYNEFSNMDSGIFEIADKFENLIVLKTLSKAYGMAAIRLGIAASNPKIISALRKIKSPYNVNAVTQEFARIIITHRAEIEKRAKLISGEMTKMRDMLLKADLPFVKKIFSTQANFVLIEMESSELAVELTNRLAENGIAIRCFAKNASIRISCGTSSENYAVYCEIVKILNNIKKSAEKSS